MEVIIESQSVPLSQIEPEPAAQSLEYDEEETDILERPMAPTPSERTGEQPCPKHLMEVLSQHQIEWAAMVELQNADQAGILRGLTSRQIRWLVREGRSKTWLVGTAGPLIEEENERLFVDKNVMNTLDHQPKVVPV